MSLINTGVNYPVERGGSGKFKALSTVTSALHSLSSTTSVVLVPAKGNAIVLSGIVNAVNAFNGVTISGSLYGNVVDNKPLGVTGTVGYFYIAQNFSTPSDKINMVNGLQPILFETDEVVTISTTTVTSNNIYLSYQEGYIL